VRAPSFGCNEGKLTRAWPGKGHCERTICNNTLQEVYGEAASAKSPIGPTRKERAKDSGSQNPEAQLYRDLRSRFELRQQLPQVINNLSDANAENGIREIVSVELVKLSGDAKMGVFAGGEVACNDDRVQPRSAEMRQPIIGLSRKR